ncbi:MAG: tetratricopeptide repeat protein [Phycisphaerales bacterium]
MVRRAASLSGRARERFIEDSCGDDVELRRRVVSILTAQESATLGGAEHTRDGDVPEDGVSPGVRAAEGSATRRADAGASALPRRIGNYVITGLLGEGGMGMVYLAEQEKPRRTVALKVVRPGFLSPTLLKRFELESEILARLQHPGIGQIHEAGTAMTEAGPQPYFAMEYVRGEVLTAYAEARHLDVRHRLELFVKVCDAVQHAHTKGVVHRDLKPANILVTEAGDPKILDFGIARATDADVQSATMQTGAGQLIGTIAYMSPEQLAGNTHDLDTRSDVYTLGVVLYELLSGRLPHQVQGKTVADAVRTIEDHEPRPLGTVDRHYRGDLQTIVGKAMERDRERRYQSAADFAGDIGRFLRDEPILARPPSTSYKLIKFARRNTGLVAGIGVALLLLFAGIGATSWQAARATRGWKAAEEARDAARVERDGANAMSRYLRDMFLSIDPENAMGREVTVREVLDEAARKVATSFSGQERIEASMRNTLATTYKAIGRLGEAEAHHRAALEILRRLDGNEHDDTIETIRNLSVVLADEAKFDEAERLSREAVALCERTRGHEHPDTALAMGELARVLQETGRYEQADALMKESIRIGLSTVGARSAPLISIMHNYGTSLKDHGRLEEAERYLRDVLKLRIDVHGEQNPQTTYTMNNLGATLQRLGKNDEALALFEKTLAIRLAIMGPEHPATITAMSNLGVTYLGMGRKEDAEPLLRASYEAYLKALGAEHSKTLIAMANIAYLYEEQGKFDDAAALYGKIVDARRRASGGKDPETWTSMNNLAMLQHSRGELEEARALYVELLDLCGQSLPADHYYVAIFRNNYGDCLTDLRRFDDAERELLSSTEVLEKSLGAGHARTIKAYGRLRRLYEAWGKEADAARYEEKAKVVR